MNSTDLTIQAAGVWLLESFFSWDAIPDLDTVQFLNGENYWMNTAELSTKVYPQSKVCSRSSFFLLDTEPAWV